MILLDTTSLNNPVEGCAVRKFESHASIFTLKENVSVDLLFQFELCQVSEFGEKFLNLMGKMVLSKIPSNRYKEIPNVCTPSETRFLSFLNRHHRLSEN